MSFIKINNDNEYKNVIQNTQFNYYQLNWILNRKSKYKNN